jgi:hypothetical protein
VRCAGGEICDLLTAMNTGLEGGCGTVHANSAADVPARLEALAGLGGLPRSAVHAQVASALDAVIHISRDHSGNRRVSEVSVFVRDPGDRAGANRTGRGVHPRGAFGAGAGQSSARAAARPMMFLICLTCAVLAVLWAVPTPTSRRRRGRLERAPITGRHRPRLAEGVLCCWSQSAPARCC